MTKKEKELFDLLEKIEGTLAGRVQDLQGLQDNPTVRPMIERNMGYLSAMQDLQLYLLGSKTELKTIAE